QNIRTALETVGGSLTDVVSLRIYLVDYQPDQGGIISDALRRYFPTDPPVATWIGVQCLANEGFIIEIEAIAVIE
ncbi:MAG: RidA family protein, partial [Chloroflexota bacterium]